MHNVALFSFILGKIQYVMLTVDTSKQINKNSYKFKRKLKRVNKLRIINNLIKILANKRKHCSDNNKHFQSGVLS